jgi:hypothetical protein
MARIVILVHIILATTLAGILVLVTLVVPSLAEQGMKLIPLAAAIGFIAAIPASIWISRRILQQTRGA